MNNDNNYNNPSHTFCIILLGIQEVPPDQRPEDVVGRPMRHLSAIKQATGEAVYCDDMPKYEGKPTCLCELQYLMPTLWFYAAASGCW